MKEKKQNEELQSRREFFKQAAKKVIPVVGAIALASSPILAQAAEKEPMGCSSGSCYHSCTGTCQGTCQGTCKGGCQDRCNYDCTGTCKGTCRGGCGGTCRYSSY